MRGILKILAYLAVAIVLVALAYLNSQQLVDVTYWPGHRLTGVPIFLVILGAMFLGVLVAGVVGAVEHVRARMRARELERRIAELEAEIRELRNLPIAEGPRQEPGEADAPGPAPTRPTPRGR